jgi:hypothetical protein
VAGDGAITCRIVAKRLRPRAGDMLAGSAGLDWFLFNRTDDKGTDLSVAEFADVLDYILVRRQSWIDRRDGCFVLVLSGAVLVLVLGLGVSRSIAITITSRSTRTDKAPPEPVNPRLTGH